MHPGSQRDIITAFISKLLLVTVHNMTGLIQNLMLIVSYSTGLDYFIFYDQQ